MFFELTDVKGKKIVQNSDEVAGFHEINFEDRSTLGLPNNAITLMKMKPYGGKVQATGITTPIAEIVRQKDEVQGKWKVVQ